MWFIPKCQNCAEHHKILHTRLLYVLLMWVWTGNVIAGQTAPYILHIKMGQTSGKHQSPELEVLIAEASTIDHCVRTVSLRVIRTPDLWGTECFASYYSCSFGKGNSVTNGSHGLWFWTMWWYVWLEVDWNPQHCQLPWVFSRLGACLWASGGTLLKEIFFFFCLNHIYKVTWSSYTLRLLEKDIC